MANGVVHTLETMTAPSTAGPCVEAAGIEPTVTALLDALGVFDLFKKRFTIKDDAVYLGLIKKVLVEEGISGAVVFDAGTPVSDLVVLFEGTGCQEVDFWPQAILGHIFPLLPGGHSSLIPQSLLFLHSFLFFRCLLVHDGATLRT